MITIDCGIAYRTGTKYKSKRAIAIRSLKSLCPGQCASLRGTPDYDQLSHLLQQRADILVESEFAAFSNSLLDAPVPFAWRVQPEQWF